MLGIGSLLTFILVAAGTRWVDTAEETPCTMVFYTKWLLISLYGINQAFRFVEGMWLHRKSRQIRHFLSKNPPILHHTCATCSELPSCMRTMIRTMDTHRAGQSGSLKQLHDAYYSYLLQDIQEAKQFLLPQ